MTLYQLKKKMVELCRMVQTPVMRIDQSKLRNVSQDIFFVLHILLCMFFSYNYVIFTYFVIWVQNPKTIMY